MKEAVANDSKAEILEVFRVKPEELPSAIGFNISTEEDYEE